MNNQPYHTDRVNEYPDAVLNAAETNEADIPIIPLPNPGEGGPVDNGDGTDNGGIPATPLPNPGEDGPANSGNQPFLPVFHPILPGGTGGSVTVVPDTTFPCLNYATISFGRVRFFNVSARYQPFYVYLGNWMVTSRLANGDITSHVQSASGTQTVTVSGANGYVYVQEPAQVSAFSSMTIAIVGTASELDIIEISDISCNAPSGSSCLRTCSLSQNLGPLDVSIEDRNNSYTALTNVRYREVMPYTNFHPGWCQLYIAGTDAFPSTYVATTTANMSASMSYTLYIFNAPSAAEGLRTMVVSS